MTGLGRKLFFLVALLNFYALDATLATKAFYHRGRCEDKLIFYFNHEPKLLKQIDQRRVVYSLPNIELTAQARGTLKALGPEILLISDNQGLKIQVNLDSNFITKMQAYKFTPISAPYGLVIKIGHLNENSAKICEFRKNFKEIVLDFGHGGHDVGAKLGNIYEKDVVRQVGLKLAKILAQQGYIVHLTRTGDEFVPLDMRTCFANLYTDASLFISLHANHAHKAEVSGIETHRMDCDLLYNLELKNLTSCDDKHLNNDRLAQAVHNQLINITGDYEIVDRKIKRSVSQVLLGVEMPAILIELGFLSNPQEAQLLNSPGYQLRLAQGISNGINSYMLAV